MDAASWDLPTVAAVYTSHAAGIRTVGVAILAARARVAQGDTKSRSLDLYQFIDDEQSTWLQRLLHSSQLATVYVADSLPEPEMRKLLSV
jgi:hypothetical protein